jgi:hypothetical protein
MGRKSGGKNNSLKHGTFAGNFVILPDENRREFEVLHQGLVEEWKHSGTLEEHTVLGVAKDIWIKSRVDRLFREEVALAHIEGIEDEIDYAKKAAKYLSHPEVEDSNIPFPKDYLEAIEKECPRSKFTDNKSWINSVRAVVLNILTWQEFYISEYKQSPKFKGKAAAQVRELIAKKITLDERLDARIDKALKRLAQLKTFKQMLENQASLAKTINGRRITDQR